MGRFSWIIGELGQSHHKVLRGERGGRRGRGGGWGWEQGSGRATSEAGPTFGTHAAPLPHFGLYASRTVQWCACGLSASKLVVTGYSSRRNWSTGARLRNPQWDHLKAGSQVVHLSVPSPPPWDSQELWCRWSPLLLFSYLAMSDSLWLHGLQRARPPCPSPSSGVCPGSCTLNWWCYPTNLSSTALFSFSLQSFPASRSFSMSQRSH